MIKQETKVIGYFSHTSSGNVFCDGDACIIADSEDSIKIYKKYLVSNIEEKDLIKKTRLGEIINGLMLGGAYAFDQESYRRFLPLAKINGLNAFPDPDEFFSEPSPTKLHLIRIVV